MTDVSVKIKVERIDNGWLAMGYINDLDNKIRCFYKDEHVLISSVTEELKNQIKDSKHFSGTNNFSLMIEARDL